MLGTSCALVENFASSFVREGTGVKNGGEVTSGDGLDRCCLLIWRSSTVECSRSTSRDNNLHPLALVRLKG